MELDEVEEPLCNLCGGEDSTLELEQIRESIRLGKAEKARAEKAAKKQATGRARRDRMFEARAKKKGTTVEEELAEYSGAGKGEGKTTATGPGEQLGLW